MIRLPMIGLERYSTTIHHGIPYHGPKFKPTVSLSSREANIHPTRRIARSIWRWGNDV